MTIKLLVAFAFVLSFATAVRCDDIKDDDFFSKA